MGGTAFIKTRAMKAKIKGYLSRDMNGNLTLWLDPPKREPAENRWVGREWYYPHLSLPYDMFPDLAWYDNAKEVLMTLLEVKTKK